MKVLANDGISKSGIEALEKGGFEVITTTVAQEQLANYINEKQISVLLVRSATTVRKDLIDACPSIKIIGRGGVGMDNIDVAYAREKGIQVINTPASSSQSVASRHCPRPDGHCGTACWAGGDIRGLRESSAHPVALARSLAF